MDVGQELIQRGWHQGSLLSAGSAQMSWLVRGDKGTWELRQTLLDEDEYLVIVSQDCDIARAPDLGEPRVEAMRAYRTSNKGVIREASRNSVRRFLLRRGTTDGGDDEGLIADATVRVQIDKHALLALSPEECFRDGDTETPRRFRQWLAARYARPALDDAIVDAVQKPIVEAVGRLKDTEEVHHILDGIREIRFVLNNEAVPYEVELLFMREEGAGAPLVDEEDVANLAAWMANVLSKHGRAQLVAWEIFSTATISVHDYVKALPLPLEQFSLVEPTAVAETTEATPGASA